MDSGRFPRPGQRVGPLPTPGSRPACYEEPMAIRDESPYLYLTTTGRRTGLPREIEIWYTQRNARHYVISERHDRAQWVRNILVDPRVRWRVGKAMFTGRARVINPAAEPELTEAVQNRSRQKYGWGEGLIVELTPDRMD
jgi:deazaflavin-dependent oxidoreductase (nitroreductase family)